jgi:hypothetical protein
MHWTMHWNTDPIAIDIDMEALSAPISTSGLKGLIEE